MEELIEAFLNATHAWHRRTATAYLQRHNGDLNGAVQDFFNNPPVPSNLNPASSNSNPSSSSNSNPSSSSNLNPAGQTNLQSSSDAENSQQSSMNYENFDLGLGRSSPYVQLRSPDRSQPVQFANSGRSSTGLSADAQTSIGRDIYPEFKQVLKEFNDWLVKHEEIKAWLDEHGALNETTVATGVEDDSHFSLFSIPSNAYFEGDFTRLSSVLAIYDTNASSSTEVRVSDAPETVQGLARDVIQVRESESAPDAATDAPETVQGLAMVSDEGSSMVADEGRRQSPTDEGLELQLSDAPETVQGLAMVSDEGSSMVADEGRRQSPTDEGLELQLSDARDVTEVRGSESAAATLQGLAPDAATEVRVSDAPETMVQGLELSNAPDNVEAEWEALWDDRGYAPHATPVDPELLKRLNTLGVDGSDVAGLTREQIILRIKQEEENEKSKKQQRITDQLAFEILRYEEKQRTKEKREAKKAKRLEKEKRKQAKSKKRN